MASPPSGQHPFRTASTTRSTATGTGKFQCQNKSSFLTDGITFIGVAMASLLLVWAVWSFIYFKPSPGPDVFSTTTNTKKVFTAKDCGGVNLRHDPPDPTFYDDPSLSYSVGDGKPMKNWDEKRKDWLKHHPSFAAGVKDRILLLTGSQPSPCKNPIGDHLLLRFFKNKVDYCRIHGYQILYNNLHLQPKMTFFWAKIPVVRAAMFAHPEVEWIWWLDSDAAFTDMEFKLPLDKYRDHNMVIHGWPDKIYGKEPSWLSINAGVFLIRNCQWSLDMMDEWASMSTLTPAADEWGQKQMETFKDKVFPDSDDQSALVYLMLKGKKPWAERIYVETEFYFEGYWVVIVGTLETIQEEYAEIERRERLLRRRHAEVVSEHYGEARESYLERELEQNGKKGKWKRRPFITHFVGCQPCNGKRNQMYSEERCLQGMESALNFADNQVLRTFGFVHPHLLNSSVSPLPFDYPAEE
ncbi:galactomannan galactosyltransferase 1-like [Macadamia integrifolia]|uniref:galactomannan galactosyltransferase 1-like n=1 Tax=Macadamia integrifolia TaxID=60698 RepID=UPI001C4F0AB3|nr:galactomannan galactosyltransferase 1-like [Macadamia integrifolia]